MFKEKPTTVWEEKGSLRIKRGHIEEEEVERVRR